MVKPELEIHNCEKFTIEAIQQMGHCVGWDVNRLPRNYYKLKNGSDLWRDLVNRGYAGAKNVFGENVYFLTEKGIRLVRIFTGK